MARNSWSEVLVLQKTNALLNLINREQDIDKTYLCAKDTYKLKYQFLINKRESTALNLLNDSKNFIEDSNNLDDIYKKIEEYNPNKNEDFKKYYTEESDEGYFLEIDVQYLENLYELQNNLPFLTEGMNIEKVEKLVANLHDKTEYVIHIRKFKKRKILIVFDDMIADMDNNKNLNKIVTELFIRTRKLNTSFAFITQSYFKALKDVKFRIKENFNKLCLIIHQILTLKTLCIFKKNYSKAMFFFSYL